MKKKYLIIAGLVVAIAAIVAIVMVVVSGDEKDENEIEELAEITDTGFLEEMQLDPPGDYIEQLKDIIVSGTDPYIRERGIFTLTDIALRENDTDEIVDFLKDIAVNESNDNVRTAAYANVDLIRQTHPLPRQGSLELTISGEIKKGSTITLIATISSSIEVSDAIIGIQRLHHDIEPVSSPATNVHLNAGETQRLEFELKLNETGEYTIPVTLMLSFDQVDYEEIHREVVLTVNETSGEYYVADEEGV